MEGEKRRTRKGREDEKRRKDLKGQDVTEASGRNSQLGRG